MNPVRKVKGPCTGSQKQEYFPPEPHTLRMSLKRIQGPSRQQMKWKRKPHTTFSAIRKVENQDFLYLISFH